MVELSTLPLSCFFEVPYIMYNSVVLRDQVLKHLRGAIYISMARL